MADVNEREMMDDARSLVDSFHRVGSLIPEGQSLKTISKDTTVAKALEIMEEKHYSQLPVVAGKVVLGVFSYRSFAQEATKRQRSERNTVLADLPVEEFMEDFSFVAASQDWTKIQRQLDEKDGFFVGDPDEISGLVTIMDVYQYFRRIADPFIQVAEIEEPLRHLITERIPKDKRAEVFGRVLAGSYATGKLPQQPKDLSLNDKILIVTTRDNWSYFQGVLGQGDRAFNNAKEKLKDIPKLRNDAFHFNRKLQPHELKKIVDCRNWLHRALRAYEGERKSTGQSKEIIDADINIKRSRHKSPSTKNMNRQRMMDESSPATAALFNWIVGETETSHPDYTLGWHKNSFSVRRRLTNGSVPFLYCYPSQDRFDVYLGELKQSSAVLVELRQSLLNLTVLTETGKHTLQAFVGEHNIEKLKHVYNHLIKELERYGYWE